MVTKECFKPQTHCSLMEGGGRAFVAATKQVTKPGKYLQNVLFSASQVRGPEDIIRWEASEAYQVF